MDRKSVVERLLPAAREQAGYVTTAQARRLGVATDDLWRMAKREDLRRVRHGVYALPGSFSGPREDAITTWLRLSGSRLPWDSASPEVFVSHATAASLHGFGTFVPSPQTYTVLRRRFQPTDESSHLYTAQLAAEDWQWLALPEGIRLAATSPARTIVDLASAGEERDHVVDALAEAREAGLVDETALLEAIERRRRGRGRGNVDWLAAAAAHT